MPYTVDYTRKRITTDRMIRKWGMPAVLRRSGMDRPCIAAVINFLPMERLGKITNPLDRKALVSALAPDGSLLLPPDFDKARLVTFILPLADPPVEDEELRIVEPPGRIGPAGQTLFWRLTVRR